MAHEDFPKRASGIFTGAMCVLCMSLSPALFKYIVSGPVDGNTGKGMMQLAGSISGRWGLALTGLGAVMGALIIAGVKDDNRPRRRDIFWLVLLGLVGCAGAAYLINVLLGGGGPVMATWLDTAITSVCLFLIGIWIQKTPTSLGEVLGILIALAGVIYLMAGNLTGERELPFVLAAIGGAGSAVSIKLIDRTSREGRKKKFGRFYAVAARYLLFALALTVIAAVPSKGSDTVQNRPVGVIAAIVIGALAAPGAIHFALETGRRRSYISLSAFLITVPVVATVLSCFVLRVERPEGLPEGFTLAAVVIIIGSATATHFAPRQEPAAGPEVGQMRLSPVQQWGQVHLPILLARIWTRFRGSGQYHDLEKP
jgi:drug/metabolite transporter (DMT)-like permease